MNIDDSQQHYSMLDNLYLLKKSKYLDHLSTGKQGSSPHSSRKWSHCAQTSDRIPVQFFLVKCSSRV